MILDVNDGPVCDERFVNEVPAMRELWGGLSLHTDPWYSPNLSFDGGGFNLAERPGFVPLRVDEPDV